MRLVSSSDVLDFLNQAAPRAWVKRMLEAMISADEMHAYFSGGTIRSEPMVAEYLKHLPSNKLEPHSAARDKLVRKHLGREIADKIKGLNWNETFLEYENDIELVDGFTRVSPGFFVYGESDWEQGTLTVNYIPEKRERPDHLFWEAEDLLVSEFSSTDFKAKFIGMSFVFEQVELLLPNHRLDLSKSTSAPDQPERRPIGRPRRWDWESVMAYISPVARELGLLNGAVGSQAKIEALMQQWFIDQTGESPATSQIRGRASRLIEMVEKSKTQD